MNIQTFQLFCYAVEEKSISGAAKRAFLSQPAATKKMKQLEDHYSTLLFERHHTPLLLTPAGKKLYYYASTIVQEYEESKEVLEQERNPGSQTLKIGSSYTLGEYVLSEIISAFQHDHPAQRIQLSISNTPSVLSALEERAIDLAFVEGDITTLDLDKKIITYDNIVLITAPGHKWASQQRIVPKDLLEERLIRREENSATRRIIENHIREKVPLEKVTDVLELSTTQAIKSAVLSGLGYGFVSRLAVRQELQAGLLAEVKVSGIHIQRPLWAARRVQRFPKESVEQFSTFVQQFLQKDAPV
ncbi:LysR family transcriptional regulator [Bacillus piscicola]|uniref:LysR family transcriptional regulator n=1 Tax=Bacillus piscicola TaxID=1632684 RepID=UPI001F092711|nr:LysR family transcriptional regulator [Bacillus piscicola]